MDSTQAGKHVSSTEGKDIVRLAVFFAHDCPSPFGQQLAPGKDRECCTPPNSLGACNSSAPSVREISGADAEVWRSEDVLPIIVPKTKYNFITHLVLDDIDNCIEDREAIALSIALDPLNAVTTVFVRFNKNGPDALLTLAAGDSHLVLPALRDIIVEQASMEKILLGRREATRLVGECASRA